MATFAADQRQARKGAAKAPISSHPAFPAIVALWFAALLGLGSMILPGILLERLSVVTGIASLIPSAAPPLGFTARAILALAAAMAGAVTGLLLARQVARGNTPRIQERFVDEEPVRRPLSAHDELGEEGLAPAEEGFGRATPRGPEIKKRRALAIAEDDTRSDYLASVPIPGNAPGTSEADEDETLELGEFANPRDCDDDREFAMTESGKFAPPADIFEEDEEPEFVSAPAERQQFVPVETTAPETSLVAQAFAEPDIAEVDAEAADALPFSAPSLRRKSIEPDKSIGPELQIEEDDDLEDEDMPDFSMPSRKQQVQAPEPFEPEAVESESSPKLSIVENRDEDLAAVFEQPADDRPLDDLGLVQLAARLGASLERRRAQRAAQGLAAPAPRPIFAAETEDFDAAAADEAARARADFFGSAQDAEADVVQPKFESTTPATPGALTKPDKERAPDPHDDFDEPVQPHSPLAGLEFEEDEEEDDFAASFSLPKAKSNVTLSSFAEEPEADVAGEDADEEDTDEDSQDEYSSLLAMKNPFQRQNAEFVRVDEPEPDEDEVEPMVTFPQRAVKKVEGPAPAADTAQPGGTRPFDPPAGAQPKRAARDQGDAERELRAALETLQRMSGAA